MLHILPHPSKNATPSLLFISHVDPSSAVGGHDDSTLLLWWNEKYSGTSTTSRQSFLDSSLLLFSKTDQSEYSFYDLKFAGFYSAFDCEIMFRQNMETWFFFLTIIITGTTEKVPRSSRTSHYAERLTKDHNCNSLSRSDCEGFQDGSWENTFVIHFEVFDHCFFIGVLDEFINSSLNYPIIFHVVLFGAMVKY